MNTLNTLFITLTSNYRFGGQDVIDIREAIKKVDKNVSSFNHEIKNWDRFRSEKSGTNPMNGTGDDYQIVDTLNDSVFKDELNESDAIRLVGLLNNNFNDITSLRKKS